MKAMRKECVTVEADGSYTVKGSGRFVCRFVRRPSGTLYMIDGAGLSAAARLFEKEARITIEKHFTNEK